MASFQLYVLRLGRYYLGSLQPITNSVVSSGTVDSSNSTTTTTTYAIVFVNKTFTSLPLVNVGNIMLI